MSKNELLKKMKAWEDSNSPDYGSSPESMKLEDNYHHMAYAFSEKSQNDDTPYVLEVHGCDVLENIDYLKFNGYGKVIYDENNYYSSRIGVRLDDVIIKEEPSPDNNTILLKVKRLIKRVFS